MSHETDSGELQHGIGGKSEWLMEICDAIALSSKGQPIRASEPGSETPMSSRTGYANFDAPEPGSDMCLRPV